MNIYQQNMQHIKYAIIIDTDYGKRSRKNRPFLKIFRRDDVRPHENLK